MSKQAIITLTPLEPYFFGSEITHGDGGANYFAKSNRWPQQSTLCGVMRHLLHENGYDRGLHSFNPDDPALNDYGDLLALSPLFMERVLNGRKIFYLRQAIDRYKKEPTPSFALRTGSGYNLFLTENTQRLMREFGERESTEVAEMERRDWQQAPVWFIPDTKKSSADDWVNPDVPEPVSAADIFLEFTRPGITKSRGGAPRKDEANFYKQTAYRLEPGWSFAVLAVFHDAVDLERLDGYCLPIGGEKTVFSIGVKAESRSFKDLFPKTMFYPNGNPPLSVLVLTSDACIPEEAMCYIAAGATETTDFRHIRTHLKSGGRNENYGPLRTLRPFESPDPQGHTLTKSAKYSLFQRGSVLVCKNAKDLADLEAAISLAEWQKIGFNHFFSYQ